MHYGGFMMGAQSRLLPPSLPFRFFAVAAGFHLAAWAVLARFARDVVDFHGGLSPVLSSIHFITLGVLTMTAMGAAFQLLPVATGKPMLSVRSCASTFWYFTTGLLFLTFGMDGGSPNVLLTGATLTIVGLSGFFRLIALNLRHVKTMPVVTWHIWTALACLVLVALLGGALTSDYLFAFLPDHAAAALIHVLLATYGFMGMLAQGFSFILVPMFCLSQPADEKTGRRSAAVWGLALAVSIAGALLNLRPLIITAGGLGLVAAGLHLWCMNGVMRSRMRLHLGESFLLIRLAWLMLPTSILLGIAATAGIGPETTLPLFVFVLIFGWLLTFMLGVLQRIMPFLASMHSAKKGRKPVLVSTLTADRPLRLHLICHTAALAAVAAGIAVGNSQMVRLGAILGTVGAIAFIVFAALLWRRLSDHLRPLPPSSI